MKDGFKSTPGPWFAGKRDRAGARVLATQHGADGLVAGRIENPANARLIATAPELLADGMAMAGVEIVAGRLVCDSCGCPIAEGGGCGCEIDERDPVTHERRARLRATIAKATGEKP